MNEKQLQAKMIMTFSQLYPNDKGLLFAVNNEANSDKQAMTFKALGVVRGVSDLIYCLDGKLIGIEVKYSGRKHSRAHIMNQYQWGMRIQLSGGDYYIVSSLEAFLSVIEGNINNQVYTLDKIYALLKDSKSTVIFQ